MHVSCCRDASALMMQSLLHPSKLQQSIVHREASALPSCLPWVYVQSLQLPSHLQVHRYSLVDEPVPQLVSIYPIPHVTCLKLVTDAYHPIMIVLPLFACTLFLGPKGKHWDVASFIFKVLSEGVAVLLLARGAELLVEEDSCTLATSFLQQV